MKITMLGCGGSGGVPLIGNEWGACDPSNPKNRRLRPSIYIEAEGLSILVDTSPDLREQLLTNSIKKVDAILYTHAHADHVHGIDDIRGMNRIMQKAIPAYATQKTMDEIQAGFGYIFRPLPEGHGFYKPQLTPHIINGQIKIGDLDIIPFEQNHGFTTSLGFRIKDFAYSTDVVELSDAAFEKLAGINVWIVDCFMYDQHHTHAHLAKVLEWVGRLKPARTILTHMSARLDYDALKAKLPAHIEPGYDGMIIAA